MASVQDDTVSAVLPEDRPPALGGHVISFQKHCDVGLPDASCFNVETRPAPAADSLVDGEVLVTLLVVSVDPYMRSRLRTPAGAKSYLGSFEIGAPVDGFVTGRVTASRNASWPVGAYIGTSAPYATRQRLTPAQLANPFTVDLSGLVTDETAALGVGVFGMPGATAYYGLLHVATGAPLSPSANPRPPIVKPGTTAPPAAPLPASSPALRAGSMLYVNAARGAVGSLVVQIAAQFGVRVLACAGGPEKCAWVRQHGAAATIDYREMKSVAELREAMVRAAVEVTGESEETLRASGAFDHVFENVGGEQFAAYQPLLRTRARVAVCGAISGYNDSAANRMDGAPALDLWSLVGRCVTVEGFLVAPLMMDPPMKRKWLEDMRAWVDAGVVVPTSTVIRGASRFLEAFNGMMTGKNEGKMVLDVTEL
eukprot:TRINITY_DN514_c0_g1_i1.p1 TRINITY_DN514_c0_g1~~TRINITY_DN514_c0_g1_i1.p1  ORF type:complete len:425 (+),score=84.35 TRINITY_DN514_c0_g1_i1:34-1308(+)